MHAVSLALNIFTVTTKNVNTKEQWVAGILELVTIDPLYFFLWKQD